MEIAPASSERLHVANPYPKLCYVQSLGVFFGANYLFHQQVFRRVGSRPQFAAFMLVNAFTSMQVSECFNYSYAKRTATIYDNTKEIEHRSVINHLVRTKMLNQRLF
jgi:hypothetical protein